MSPFGWYIAARVVANAAANIAEAEAATRAANEAAARAKAAEDAAEKALARAKAAEAAAERANERRSVFLTNLEPYPPPLPDLTRTLTFVCPHCGNLAFVPIAFVEINVTCTKCCRDFVADDSTDLISIECEEERKKRQKQEERYRNKLRKDQEKKLRKEQEEVRAVIRLICIWGVVLVTTIVIGYFLFFNKPTVPEEAKLTAQNFSAVKNGMTMADVKMLLGETKFKVEWGRNLIWTYAGSGHCEQIIFTRDSQGQWRVSGKENLNPVQQKNSKMNIY